MRVYPVILCGGSGTRLWPVSRPSRPKQFAPLVGDRTLFERTALRAAGIDGCAKLVIVTSEAQAPWVAASLAKLKVPAEVLLEPEGRDSAPAMAVAAALIAAQDPAGLAVFLASDHHVPDDGAFQQAVRIALEGANAGRIVTLGIRPTAPNTAYGYIRPAPAAEGGAVLPVAAFREKPDRGTAERYVAEGCLWNSGNFIAACQTLLAELAVHAPAVRAAAERALATAVGVPNGLLLGQEFTTAPKISIDYAVMEKTARASVLPVDFAWSDLGAWDALSDVLPKDADGNAIAGEAIAVDTRHSLVMSAPGMLTATVGLDGVAVIAERDSVLVCRLDRSQAVKTVVDELRKQRRPEVDFPPAPRPQADEKGAAALTPWLMTAAFPLWWAVGADPRWGFHESLDPQGRPTGEARRCRVQARQVYVYARAGQMGWAGPWERAVDHGLAALTARYRRPDGLFRTLVAPDGAILDDRAMTYDQAFIVLALAAARAVVPKAEDRACEVMDALKATRAAPGGGWREEGGAVLANPHMHLFEAAMAWIEAGGGERWHAYGTEIVRLALARFVDPRQGAIHEDLAEDRTGPGGKGGRSLEPGHQFEWAWLLARWSVLGHDPAAGEAARRLYAAGRRGLDAARGVAVDEMAEGLTVAGTRARFWPQTEWFKAACLLSEPGSGDRERAARAVWRYLDQDRPGLWRDKMQPDGRFVDEAVPASSLYHLVTAAIQADAAA